jgi:hypothetical protein
MMNFDEATFPDPIKVDFERRPLTSSTFGQGPHKCVGASIARAQLSHLHRGMACSHPRLPGFPQDAADVRAGRYGLLRQAHARMARGPRVKTARRRRGPISKAIAAAAH